MHRITKTNSCIPKLGEIVILIGEERNRSKWRKGKLISLVKGRDGVVRGVTFYTKDTLSNDHYKLCARWKLEVLLQII